MQPGQGANPYAPQQPIVTGQMGVPVIGAYYPPTSAVAALILGCLSFVLCGLFMSIPALIMAGQALKITKNMIA